ncbi:hypothetical protein WA026_012453 [Henosepilachna vigintioctopunctata]|uniref:Cyclic nucleotide-binding domain-containing protein n=1 Tax=Henosepilachna vigintioctopunctata TaxID=420089 RepID=A0AAW1UX82_9CUCU
MVRRSICQTTITPEEKAARAIRARRRFRAAARLALANQYWLEDFSDMKLGDNVTKNIRLLTRGKKKSSFTLEQKRIMNTQKNSRTEEEKKKLHRVVGGLKCFRRYPTSVKEQLAEVTYFTYIPPKRTVVRQNDDARALFFLLSGESSVYQTIFDKVLNEWVTNEVGILEPGSMFGEVSLLHGVKRTATVVTTDHCEMLVLYKEDFDAVLKSTVMAEWDEIKHCMSLFSYFDTWDEIAVRDCCILSKVKNYGIDDIVLSDDIGNKKVVYFLVEGQCHLVEYMDLEETKIGCKITYKLLSGKEESYSVKKEKTESSIGPMATLDKHVSAGSLPSKHDVTNTLSALLTKDLLKSKSAHQAIKKTVKTHFIRIGTFNPQACFNIGEKFERRFVITSKKTKILLIPRYWLVQKNKEIWSYIKHFLNQRLPDTESVFRDFLQQKKWHEYKMKLVQEILTNSKKVNLNNLHNVPYSIRMQEDISSYDCRASADRYI